MVNRKSVALIILIISILLWRGFSRKDGGVKPQKPSLSNVVGQAMAGAQGTYGIAIKNLKNGQLPAGILRRVRKDS